jgi:electron transport complex protein RnfG
MLLQPAQSRGRTCIRARFWRKPAGGLICLTAVLSSELALMKTVFKSIFIWLGCTVCVLVAGGPALATDFWKPQALLAEQFHASERVRYVRVHVDAAERALIEARLGRPLPKPEYTVFVATSHGNVDGYALFDDQLGLHEPISFATFFSADAHITRVEVVTYREPYGDGVRADRFRRQFVGRNGQSRFRPGTDIDAISGATISSRSLCVGVERAAALLEMALRSKAIDTASLPSSAGGSLATR